MTTYPIKFIPNAQVSIDCKANDRRCQSNVIFNPQKEGDFCGKVDGGVIRVCDQNLNCNAQPNHRFKKCEPLDKPCTDCSEYRLCNGRDDSNCVSGFQNCRPFPHTNYKNCEAIIKP